MNLFGSLYNHDDEFHWNRCWYSQHIIFGVAMYYAKHAYAMCSDF